MKESPLESLDYEALEAYLHAVFAILEGRSAAVKARRTLLEYLAQRKDKGLSEDLAEFLREFYRARFGQDLVNDDDA